jgi:uncharacterized protein YllA (UPF0747 family)
LINSFLLLDNVAVHQMEQLSLDCIDFFQPIAILEIQLVKRDSALVLNLNKEKEAILEQYQAIKLQATKVDRSLQKHIEALQVNALHKIEAVEKKMLKAEKKKFEAQIRKIQTLKNQLFPNGVLQERVDNLSPYYAKWGADFIQLIYQYSLTTESTFCIIEEKTA